MNRRDAFAERLRRERAIAIVRADAGVEEIVRAVWAGGVGLVEVSLTSRDALAAIVRLAAEATPERQIGAGTVLDGAQAAAATEAGASFLVSPALDTELVAWAAREDVPHLPGVLTPTELAQARAAGAGPLKLFPATLGGPAYVRALLGPFPDAELVPTGGIDAANAGDYLAAGAVAVAVGSSLTGLGDPARIEQAAAELAGRLARG